jgi:hypothetical protein
VVSVQFQTKSWCRSTKSLKRLPPKNNGENFVGIPHFDASSAFFFRVVASSTSLKLEHARDPPNNDTLLSVTQAQKRLWIRRTNMAYPSYDKNLGVKTKGQVKSI